MKSLHIKINNISDVATFVRNASDVYGDVLIKKGKFVIDGKSLMGMFSLDLSTGVTVEYPEDATNFEDYINTFKAD